MIARRLGGAGTLLLLGMGLFGCGAGGTDVDGARRPATTKAVVATPGPTVARSASRTPSVKPEAGRDFRNALGMRMVWCPPGSFAMGAGSDHPAEKPVHTVRFAEGFWISRTEVTQGQWEATGRTHASPTRGADLPVTGISWTEAVNFASSLAARDFAIGVVHRRRRYDLPSEAQWEYACRAGETGPWEGAALDAVAWHEGNAGGRVHAVATRKANAWGLHDMLGNVSEWVLDPWRSGYAGAPADGSAWMAGGTTDRITRGGHHEAGAAFCRPWFRRFFWSPGGGPTFNGFRVVLTPRR